jgi:hypothetical protein
MLFLRTHSWTRAQRWLITGAVLIGLMSAGGLIYSYERYHRGPSDHVFFGTWALEGCYDCTMFITFQPNHDVIGFEDYGRDENHLDYRGRWYAGGEQLIIHYDDGGEGRLIVMKIQEITPERIRVRWDGQNRRLTRSSRKPPQAANHAMERTATRRAFGSGVARILSFQVTLALSGRRSSYSR